MHYYIVHLALWLWSVISYCGKYMEETRAQDGLTIIVAISIFLVLLKTSEFFQVLERLKDNALHPPPPCHCPRLSCLSVSCQGCSGRSSLASLPPISLSLIHSAHCSQNDPSKLQIRRVPFEARRWLFDDYKIKPRLCPVVSDAFSGLALASSLPPLFLTYCTCRTEFHFVLPGRPVPGSGARWNHRRREAPFWMEHAVRERGFGSISQGDVYSFIPELHRLTCPRSPWTAARL